MPRCEKTGLRGFRPGPIQTGLYNPTKWLEASNDVFRKSSDCAIYVAKIKALISCSPDPYIVNPFKIFFFRTRVGLDLHYCKFKFG